MCSDEFNFDPWFGSFLTSVLSELYRKQQALDLRAAYSKILAAKTETARNDARIDYLKLKHEFDDIPF
jgi:outer membrane murein-binding lipoprotein Lpp